ncbi:ABC transporter ATP-binding protein [Formosa haliotis]|uniref:ABC transporter ATP-binding protein n=1 Tax=Formosa haliotis TaxID=1555194 RepID=UPI00082658E8|nr:polysaccharide ABC transporter ATP-binding protein [Formosa haliotis]
MTILKAENISKQYRLGLIGTGTISHDLNRWWHRVRGKDDPYLKIGETNDRSSKGKSDYAWALKDINFEVKQGEVLGIIGKNGAGKSTLLKILSRVTSPTTGEIKTRGRIASLLEVGTGFHPELTGRENIYLNGAILGMTKAEIKAKEDEIIAFSGCERYVDTPVKRYSSGMRVRLAFAVAAFLEPDILVIDEVLAVGDAEFQKKAIGKMQDISRGDGRTVLFVSHDMAAIQSLCNRVLVLKNGELVYENNTADAIDFYLENTNPANNNFNNLELLKERRGDQSSVFTSVALGCEYEGRIYENVNAIYSNSKCFIDVVIKNKSNLKRKIYLSYEISDSKNISVSNVSNQFNGNTILLEGEYNKIRFEIEHIPLISKKYRLSLWGEEVGGKVFDCLEQCIEFDVEETDFFGTGKVPRAKQHGYVLLKNKCYNVK